jgi:hypothetical protein
MSTSLYFVLAKKTYPESVALPIVIPDKWNFSNLDLLLSTQNPDVNILDTGLNTSMDKTSPTYFNLYSNSGVSLVKLPPLLTDFLGSDKPKNSVQFPRGCLTIVNSIPGNPISNSDVIEIGEWEGSYAPLIFKFTVSFKVTPEFYMIPKTPSGVSVMKSLVDSATTTGSLKNKTMCLVQETGSLALSQLALKTGGAQLVNTSQSLVFTP